MVKKNKKYGTSKVHKTLEVYSTSTPPKNEIFRNILRNPETGLWQQGRNWGKDTGFISPGHWNRGQGWVLKRMVDSMDYLPAGNVERSRRIFFNPFGKFQLCINLPDNS